ncbi:hypothetical protein KIN20_026041 [Parelaphostrongylus tenuis]|uniref:Uncharacterized protein n=1 Tax=Parelaphostrongylus tenuis TaxID=148309 RepID=A0AAD5N035_PARTN|nr:hypothetical protein KIN20_026041 [Parelaphostrongylus tenuis]
MVVFTSCADPGTYPKWYIADRAYDIPWFLDIMNVNQQVGSPARDPSPKSIPWKR